MPNIVETTDAAASAATTYTLGIGQTGQGTVSSGSDVDWYRVNLVAGQTYTFALVGEGATHHLNDPSLTLRNAAGGAIANSDDDGPGFTSGLTFTATTTGVYYLEALGFDAVAGDQYGISATLGDRASYDLDMGAGILIRDTTFWGTPGTSVNLTWSNMATYTTVRDANGDLTNTGEAMSQAQVATVRLLLGAYAEVSNLTFTEVNPGGVSDNAIMRFAAYTSTNDGAGAYAQFPGSTAFGSDAGDVRLNNDSISTTSIPQGSYSYWAILHEIGHTMGLDHPGDYNAAEGVDITYAANAQFTQDSGQYSIMSYFDAINTSGEDPGASPETLLLFDILAIQQAYGVNTTTRAGNSIYGFGANTGNTYDFAVNTHPLLCIWDAGGTDTIDASGFAMAQKIDLNAGHFSDINGIAANVSIAFGAVIENATGGAGADILIGNAANNVLKGGAGADKMTGGLGNDTYYVDNASDLVTEKAGQGTDRVFSTVTFNGSLANAVGIENITLTGSAAINAAGNALNNIITGNSANNGLNGGKGADTLIGGLGNDTYTIDSTGDVITELAGQGTDTVKSAISFTLSDTLENLTLVSTRAINGIGNAGVNVIIGGEGANIIAGKGGADMLTGGAGSDTFDYNATTESSYSAYDRITDLTNSDKIDLSGIDANTSLAGNQAFSLVNAFSNHAGEVLLKYDAAKDFTVLSADVNGDGVADMRIVINGDHHTFTNFVF